MSRELRGSRDLKHKKLNAAHVKLFVILGAIPEVYYYYYYYSRHAFHLPKIHVD